MAERFGFAPPTIYHYFRDKDALIDALIEDRFRDLADRTAAAVQRAQERPVPQETNLPGEVPSLTQPFPTKPAPFDYQGITLDELVDFVDDSVLFLVLFFHNIK